MRHRSVAVLVLLCLGAVAHPLAAQTRFPLTLDLLGGYTGFVDEAFIDHAIVGGGLRVPISRRLAIGPEIVYMAGPGADRDLYLTGLVTFDIVGPSDERAPRVVPFLVVGGGLFRHSDRFGPSSFVSWEGAVTGGGGVRVAVTRRIAVGGDVRLGWEPHLRVNGLVAIALPR